MTAFLRPLTKAEITAADVQIPPAYPARRPPMTPGRLFYLCVHAPLAWLPPRTGAKLQSWRRTRWRWRMCRALRFPRPIAEATPAIELHYLTGIDYLPQTLFAIKSWVKFSGRSVRPHLYDDGSLNNHEETWLHALVPGVEIHRSTDIIRRLDDSLPAAEFPFLRKLRLAYPHLRKLTDLHTFTDGWRLVSDSDVLLFRPPSELLQLVDQNRPFFLRDCQESYGAPRSFLASLSSAPVPPQLNCGLYYVHSGAIDWNFMEDAARRLLAAHGFSFYLEQALSALVLGAVGASELSDEYLVYPDSTEARDPTRTLLHYLKGSDNPDMESAWRLIKD